MTRAFDDTKNAVTPAKPAPGREQGPVPMVDMGLGLRRESEEQDALLNHPMHSSASYDMVSTASAITADLIFKSQRDPLGKNFIKRVQKQESSRVCRLHAGSIC